MEFYLETKGVKKHYPVTKGIILSRVLGWVKAVDGVDLHIGPGETLGLLGESGCGKTTLSRLLLLLEAPTAGAIYFEGKDLSQFSAEELQLYRKSVQAVFQNPLSSLDPRMKICSIIAEPVSGSFSLYRDQLKERVEGVLQKVGLDPNDALKFPHEFSGGQRQRIAIARALISDPRLIILDEPVSSQDVSIRAQLMNLLKDLQVRFGISFLFIAHDLATVRYMSTRISVMYLGRIVETAGSDELCSDPLHPYTKALLSASLPDDPDSVGARSVVEGEVPSPINPPAGCHFHPRCSYVKPQCRQDSPILKEAREGRFVACWLY